LRAALIKDALDHFEHTGDRDDLVDHALG